MINIYPDDRPVDIRRVQMTGGSSFMITLPKNWADSVNLKKNDPVMVTPQPGGGLLLTVGNASEQDSGYPVTINVDEIAGPVALYRELIGAYIAGHSQIILTSSQPLKGEPLEAISKFTQTSIGMEIVEEDECRIVMKDLMDQTEVVPKKNVRREYLLVKRMISDVVQSAEDRDMTRLASMENRDTEVDRIHWLVQRQSSIHQMDIGLSSRMGIDLRMVTGCVAVSKTLERMGDHAVLISRYLARLDQEREVYSIDGPLSQIGKEIIELIDGAVQAWLENDLENAEKYVELSKSESAKISNLFDTAQKTMPIAATSAISLMAGSARRIAEYCGDIAESAINTAME